jgi:hypothetical protein
MRVRKKPVTVDAYQWDGDYDALFDWSNSVSDGNGTRILYNETPHGRHLYIDTLEGRFEVFLGDWVMCGVEGEFYSCKDSVFKKTYESAEGCSPVSVCADCSCGKAAMLENK